VKKQEVISKTEDFLQLGVPEAWVDVLRNMGYTLVSKLKEVEKHTKLHQDLCGYNKKNKLGLQNPTQDDVKGWIDAASAN
jgi:lysyl-tRNA synthetase class 2